MVPDAHFALAGLADGDIFEAEHFGPARLIKADCFCHGDFPD